MTMNHNAPTEQDIRLGDFAAAAQYAAQEAPTTCQGTNCSAADANGYAHSPDCITEAAEAQGWVPDNLFAYTEPGHDYPAFVSINRDADGRHRITVRSAGNGGRDIGEIHVSPETLEHMATDVLAAINGETPAPATNFNEAIDAHYKAMVDRFLGWKLPADFGPDAGIEFTAHGTHESPHWPVGTNLLTADQALAMFKHCVEFPAVQAETVALMDDPAVLRAIVDDLAQRLQTADAVILTLLQKAGGEVALTTEDCEKAVGHQVEHEVDQERSVFTFRAVPVQQPTPQ